MPKVLTNGKIKIGAYLFPDRKLTSLCVEEGNTIRVYGHFNSLDGANRFMDKLAELIGCPNESEGERKEGADNG